MSYLVATPDLLTAAATDVAGIGSTLREANAAALAPTTGVIPAAADEVSAAITSLFNVHAQGYQELSDQAAAFHAEFVQTLTSCACSYAIAESANASPLQSVEQQVLGVINAPTQVLVGRPLIGNGAHGAPGTGANGGGGGVLIGNGGGGGGRAPAPKWWARGGAAGVWGRGGE